MNEYPKIESLYNRDEKTHRFIVGQFRLPEFEYLYPLFWRCTEKLDGTNIRIGWDGTGVAIGGRTEAAQIPTFLYAKLVELFTHEKLAAVFPSATLDQPVTLYGEGFGARIQKGGNYIPDGVDFALFDVSVGRWWLRWDDVCGIANGLGIRHVPDLGMMPLHEAETLCRDGFDSEIGTAKAEGVVCRPGVSLYDHAHRRIIVKIKARDYA